MIAVESDRICQTLLKLNEITRSQLQAASLLRNSVIEASVFRAMERLVGMIAQLRSPQGGWPADLPQTPENLAPYVLEEVYDVLDAIARLENRNNQTLIPTVSAFTNCPFPFITVEELMSRLLWDLVKSSYPVMRAIGGIKACVRDDDGNWQTGLLRMVPCLSIDAPAAHWVIDVATTQVLNSLEWRDRFCPLETVVEIVEKNLCPQPTTLENFASYLQQKIALTSPTLSEWLHPISLEFLAPEKDWQVGNVQLKIDFEFIVALVAESDAIEEPPRIEPALIRLSDLNLETQYQQNAIAQALVNLCDQLHPISLASDRSSLTETLTLGEEIAENSEIANIIATADRILDQIETQTEEIRDCVRSRPTPVDDWIHRLLWHFIGTSYHVMQFVGGVEAQVLQPHQEWQMGTLRLRAIVHAVTPTRCWAMDLATGEALHFSDQTLHSDAIVKLTQMDNWPEFNDITMLSGQMLAEIRDSTPVLIPLMDGIAVEFQDSQQNWEVGKLQLSIDLAFLPKARSILESAKSAEISFRHS